MKPIVNSLAVALAVLVLAAAADAEVQITVDRNRHEDATSDFRFEKAPCPSRTDAAAKAEFAIVDGRPDANSGPVGKLHDGYLPTGEDEPRESFFFDAGTDGGRLVVDLGRAIDVRQVNTYSWHSDTRGPQVYTLYAGDGTAAGFDPRPKRDTDPKTLGWTPLAKVDTRSRQGDVGGQYGVGISDSEGSLGRFRYLLFDIARTEAADPFGNTFFSEIDVAEPNTPVVRATPVSRPGTKTFTAGEGKYRFTIDTYETPDLTRWAHDDLAPVLRQWYPKIVAMLPSEGFDAPGTFSITFRKDMPGVAGTGGTRVVCGAGWFRRNLEGEAKGAVVHELVHVVQQYGRARRTNRNAMRTPGWVVEGIADYIRWFLYEPRTRGAEIAAADAARARYDASYRVSANFLNWVTEHHDRDIVRHLNAAARQGKYHEALWKQRTGKTLQELGDLWKTSLKEKVPGVHHALGTAAGLSSRAGP